MKTPAGCHSLPAPLALIVLTVLTLASLTPARAQAPTPGERWRSTMSMEMMGMKMPGFTTEICAPKGQKEAPVAPDKNCQITNQQRSGNTSSFDMSCKGGMTGRMEMTQESPSRWSGKMTSNSPEGQMTMRMASEKLPGDCDASEMERKSNAMIAKGNAAMAKECNAAAQPGSFNPVLFVGSPASCTDAASVKTYCTNAKASAGYHSLARTQRQSVDYQGAEGAVYRTLLTSSGKLCGFNPESVRSQHCGTAQARKDWSFLAEECEEAAKPLAQAQCAGRDFTTPVSPPYVEFCSAWSAARRGVAMNAPAGSGRNKGGNAEGSAAAADRNTTGTPAGDGNAEDPPKATDKAKDAMRKGKDALKGLFGR